MTDASKRATEQMKLAILKSVISQIVWAEEPFKIFLIYYFAEDFIKLVNSRIMYCLFVI